MSYSHRIYNNATSLAEPIIVHDRIWGFCQNHDLTVRIVYQFVLDFLRHITSLPTYSEIGIWVVIIFLNDYHSVMFFRVFQIGYSSCCESFNLGLKFQIVLL